MATQPPSVTPNLGLQLGLKSSGYQNNDNFRKIDAALTKPPTDAEATALLTAGTDTVPRMWSAKQLAAYFAKKP